MKINMPQKIFFGIISFFVLGLPSLVRAQMYVPPNMFSNPVLQRSMENNNMIATGINGLIRSQMMRNLSRNGKGSKNSSLSKKPPVSQIADPTSFKASSANSIVNAFAEKSDADATQQKQVQALFDQCLQLFWKTAKDDNFPSNDLAYGFEFYVVNNYHVYKDVFSTLGDYQFDLTKAPNYVYYSREQAIYGQFRQFLGDTPEIKKLTDKEKQQFTEVLAIKANIAFLMDEQGRKNNDRQLMGKAQEMAKSNLESLFQTTADKIIIDDNGVSLNNETKVKTSPMH